MSQNLGVLSECLDFEIFLTRMADKVARKSGLIRRKHNRIVPKRIGGSLEGGLQLSNNDIHLLGNVAGVSFLEQYVEWTAISKSGNTIESMMNTLKVE
jgi:hypothetical protein